MPVNIPEMMPADEKPHIVAEQADDTFASQIAKDQQQVTLSFVNLDCDDIQIAGDFNDWQPDHGVETRVVNGVLQKVLSVKPGAYQYRLIVDGKWQEDPDNPLQVTNNYGEINSLLRVQKNRNIAHA